MKICVATNQGGLEDQVSPVFGRCPTFTFVDVEGDEIKNVEVIPNESAGAAGGAGIQAAQFVASKGVKAVIAGNYGPNAHPILNQAGVDAVSAQGNVKDTVMNYVKGEIKPVTQPTAPRFGGMGMGGGMGRGGGRGMGRGMQAMQAQPDTIPIQTSEPELQTLKNQVEQLGNQLSEIKKRVEELEK